MDPTMVVLNDNFAVWYPSVAYDSRPFQLSGFICELGTASC